MSTFPSACSIIFMYGTSTFLLYLSAQFTLALCVSLISDLLLAMTHMGFNDKPVDDSEGVFVSVSVVDCVLAKLSPLFGSAIILGDPYHTGFPPDFRSDCNYSHPNSCQVFCLQSRWFCDTSSTDSTRVQWKVIGRYLMQTQNWYFMIYYITFFHFSARTDLTNVPVFTFVSNGCSSSESLWSSVHESGQWWSIN